MKRLLAILLALTLVLSMAACTSAPAKTEEDADAPAPAAQPEEKPTEEEKAPEEEAPAEEETSAAEPVELIVFAAASMTETLTEIGSKFMEQNPNVTIQFNFDSSGTLKTQIQNGAECDVFISAGQKQMNQLDKDASAEVNTEGLDFVLEGTRFNILENKVTLVVPDGNPKGIESFDDMAAGLKDGTILLGMGNSDVPVGQYTQKILKYYELDEDALATAGCLTYGTNVKEVTTQVSEAAVDCGIIYATDAYSAGLESVDEATADMCGQVIYPAAVLRNSAHPDKAKAFLDYLTGEDAGRVFESVGFTPLA